MKLSYRILISYNLFKKSIFNLLNIVISIINILLLMFELIINTTSHLIKNRINLQSISKNINTEHCLQKKELRFDYKVFQTNTEMFPTWIDILIKKRKTSNILISLFFSLFLFMIGLTISILIDFQSNYLNTIPIYIGLTGISIAIFIIRYGSISIHKSFSELRACFMINDNQYKYFVSKWFSRMSNIKSTIFVCLILSMFFVFLTYITFYKYEFAEEYNITSIRPYLFQIQNWYTTPNKLLKFAIISLFAICIAFPLATSARILIINFFFLLDLKHIPIIPIPNLLRNRLRGITDLYMLITFSWFIGAMLFFILFFKNSDYMSLFFILCISILGFLTFITPQIIYHLLLERSEKTASKWILSSFYKKLDIELVEENDKKIVNPIEASHHFNLVTFVDYLDASVPSQRWVYSHAQVILFIVGQIITLVVSNYQHIVPMFIH